MLFSMEEIQEILKYLNRAPLGFAERLFAQGFFQRLIASCQPPGPEKEPGPEVREPDNTGKEKEHV